MRTEILNTEAVNAIEITKDTVTRRYTNAYCNDKRIQTSRILQTKTGTQITPDAYECLQRAIDNSSEKHASFFSKSELTDEVIRVAHEDYAPHISAKNAFLHEAISLLEKEALFSDNASLNFSTTAKRIDCRHIYIVINAGVKIEPSR